MPRRRFPIRVKLTIATLLPLVIAIAICSLIGFSILVTRIAYQAQDKVRSDLNSARVIYQNEIDHVRDVVRFTAAAPYMAEALAAQDRRVIAAVLVPLMGGEQLHVFTAVDAAGNVLFRAKNPETHGDNLAGELLVKRALAGETTAGTDVFPANRMLLEGPDLASQAMVRVIPTPHSKRSSTDVERSALFLVASAPVRDQAGNIVGALYAGVMLNNNNTLVDRIKMVVYEGVRQEVGGATIFLNDLRIATNVTTAEDRRAIGTKMSEEVYNRVMLMKERWIDRAFVVNEWYFSAYEPIPSLEGVPVGALYVGIREKPYTELKGRLSLLVGGVLMVGTAMGVVVARLAGSRLARPIKELESMASRVAAGERGVTIDLPSEDEIGDLADEFNRMSSALALQEEEIRTLNRSLEQKVRKRTAELEEKNRLLVETQQELLRVEKLAAVGELAAGVAHEINNPMAIIRGNAELIQMGLPPDSPALEEIGIITQQVGRVERIVANLLRFAREERQEVGAGSVDGILDEIIAQLKHHVSLDGIELEREYDAGIPEVEGDLDQLRQVFTNLLLNAVQAMPEGGRLTVATRYREAKGVFEVSVSDTGCGIPQENIDQIFNPFFTTKAGGTGLGLSVSYGIVRSHGGNIVVESRAGEGSRFTVVVPARRG